MSDPSPQSPPPPPPAPTRPYTSYNLFFQLEREYILQTLHNHTPTITPPSKIFNAATSPTYPTNAPPLPSRYASLILPYDWHIPGKTKIRKRLHRKSHGKVGFHELNDQISKAWSVADEGVREFCVRLSEIESVKYKNKKTTAASNNGKENNKKATRKFEVEATMDDIFSSLDWKANNFPHDNFVINQEGVGKSFREVGNNTPTPIILCPTISMNCITSRDDDAVDDAMEIDDGRDNLNFQSTTVSLRDSLTTTLSEVDMEDDEIMDMWETTHTDINDNDEEEHGIDSILSISRIYYTNIRDDDNNTQHRVKQEEDAWQGITNGDTRSRESFIDAEYEKFLKIGKHFSTTKQILLPSELKQNAVTACQA
mmetsp:Transcript_12341/g.26593  ORF Transcript_12341/g.26593 Transcript_12341/m.26593 type:complete len:369 (-) Transcript_12341:90-1196(-)